MEKMIDGLEVIDVNLKNEQQATLKFSKYLKEKKSFIVRVKMSKTPERIFEQLHAVDKTLCDRSVYEVSHTRTVQNEYLVKYVYLVKEIEA